MKNLSCTMNYSALLLVAVLCFTLTFAGCGGMPTFAHFIAIANAELPNAQMAYDDFAAAMPAADKEIFAIALDAGKTDLPLIADETSKWLADPTTSRRTKIEGLFGDLVGKINGNVLSANRVVNTDSQKKALRDLRAFATILSIIDAALIVAMPQAQAKATAAKRQAKLKQLLPLLDRGILEAAARRNGTTVAAVTSYEQALGF